MGHNKISLKWKSLNLHDLGYTWWNKQEGKATIFARLGKTCVNSEWIQYFPDAIVKHLSSNTFDHTPILIEVCKDKEKRKVMF